MRPVGSALSEEDFQKETRSRVLLFLSADLANSTQRKRNYLRHCSYDWLEPVVNFLTKFETKLKSARVDLTGSNPQDKRDELELWKFQGDEQIFKVEIKSHKEVDLHIRILQKAIADWNSEVNANENSKDLLLKGTAWLAGFPVANAVLSVGGKDDYLGPSMDAGFRLSKASTPRRITLSVELAWWLLEHGSELKVRFDGREQFKGIAEETGYPLLWLETTESKYQKEEDLALGRDKQTSADVIKKLCAAFIVEFGVPRFLPFLPDDDSSTNSQYDDQFEAARQFLKAKVFILDGEDATGSDNSAKQASAAKELLEQLGMTAHAPPR